MKLIEYIDQAKTFDHTNTTQHAALGLLAEIGKVYGVLACIERGDSIDRTARMTSDLGDVAWYLARLTDLTKQNTTTLITNRPEHIAFEVSYAALNGISNIAHLVLVWPHDILNNTAAIKLWTRWFHLCQIEGLDPDIVLQANIDKLTNRCVLLAGAKP